MINTSNLIDSQHEFPSLRVKSMRMYRVEKTVYYLQLLFLI